MYMKMAIKLNHRPSTIYVPNLFCLLNSKHDYIKKNQKKKTKGSYDAGLQEKLTVFVISTYRFFNVDVNI